ncbi:MDR family MFS transporter [Pandoraea commovens]|uniref:MFS transporter n=1 Tax=Pandoraea commovens TaxID=2508289 RepID=A0A5E4WBI2_9BURK|nr:MDR family MFS transporter [Pandoraea commovens]UVA80845.1 MFS transporter [Pandoraea commovens]VVE21503.1 Multidrug resistance protein 3 [Pandoraea commovens]
MSANDSQTTPAGVSPTSLTPAEVKSILTGLLLIMFLGSLDQTIVAPALPTIARDLGSFDAVSWVVTAYLLSSTAITPIVGKLSDLFGRRVVIAASVAVFLVGSVLCALAPSMLALIVARGVQGLGGGGLIALSNTVIADIVSPRERGRYQGYISGMFAVSGVAGPVTGGVFAQYLNWTLIFWINIPLGLLAIYLSDRALRRLPRREGKPSIDYLGSLLLIVSTVCLLLALTWGGHRYAWLSAEIGGLVAATVIVGAVFLRHQRTVREPLLPVALLANPVFRMTSTMAVLVMMVNISIGIYVPLYLQLQRGESASSSGLMLILPLLGIVVGALSSGHYMRQTGHYKRPPQIGLPVAFAGLAIIALGVQSLPLTVIGICLGLVGIGFGSAMPVMTVATQNAVAPRDIGIATAAHAFFRALGGMIGVAMFGALIVGLLVAGDNGSAPRELTDFLRPGGAPAGMEDHLRLAFGAFFGGSALIAALAIVALARLPELPLRQSSGNEATAIE